MKKLIYILTAISAFSFVGCNKSDSGSSNGAAVAPAATAPIAYAINTTNGFTPDVFRSIAFLKRGMDYELGQAYTNKDDIFCTTDESAQNFSIRQPLFHAVSHYDYRTGVQTLAIDGYFIQSADELDMNDLTRLNEKSKYCKKNVVIAKYQGQHAYYFIRYVPASTEIILTEQDITVGGSTADLTLLRNQFGPLFTTAAANHASQINSSLSTLAAAAPLSFDVNQPLESMINFVTRASTQPNLSAVVDLNIVKIGKLPKKAAQ